MTRTNLSAPSSKTWWILAGTTFIFFFSATPCIAQPDWGPVRFWGNPAGYQNPPTQTKYFKQVATGLDWTVGLRPNGSILVWGLYDINKSTAPSPDETGFIDIDTGETHSIALKQDGTAVVWGLWVPQSPAGCENQPPPDLATNCPSCKFTDIVAGEMFNAGILTNGNIFMWGRIYCFNPNDFSNHGLITGGLYVELSANGHFLLAQKANLQLVGWGPNPPGQNDCHFCTEDRYKYFPGTYPPPQNYWGTLPQSITGFSAGHAHSLVLDQNEVAFGWGNNKFGQTHKVTSGTPNNPPNTPSNDTCVPINLLNCNRVNPPVTAIQFRSIEGGYYHTTGVKLDGRLVAWGSNVSHQVSPLPPGAARYLSISSKYNHGVGISMCYADCDGNGVLDAFDITCFTTKLVTSPPDFGADCDENGVLDAYDYLCFINLFNNQTGCEN